MAQASFDAWVKYYRQDENTPNATVSYYTKGALVALCFDLTLRARRPRHARRRDARAVAALQGRPDDRGRLRRGAASELGGRAFDARARGLGARHRRAAAGGAAGSARRRRGSDRRRRSCRSGWALRVAESAPPASQVKTRAARRRGRAGRLRRRRRVARRRRLAHAPARRRAAAGATTAPTAPLLVARDQRMLSLVVPAGAEPAPGAVQLAARPAAGRRRDGAAAAAARRGRRRGAGAAALALRRAWLHA